MKVYNVNWYDKILHTSGSTDRKVYFYKHGGYLHLVRPDSSTETYARSNPSYKNVRLYRQMLHRANIRMKR